MTASTEFSVIDMTLSHIMHAAALEREVFSSPWSEQSLIDFIRREDTIFLACIQDERFLGYIGAYVTYPEISITNVVTDGAFRKRGVASALLKELTERAKKIKAEKIILEVRLSNIPAIALYEKFGFAKVGIRKNFYTKPREDAYVMILNIQKD